MRVVFLGTPSFAVPTLRALLHSPYDVCAVFTQPDRPSGRGQRLHPPPVKVLANQYSIPVFQPPKIRTEDNRPVLKGMKPEFIVVAAFGQILPRWLLDTAGVAPVNVHPSLLPKYRGAAPVVWPILNGDEVSGVTTMLMDERLDTGPILLREEMPISDAATAGELEAALAEAGAGLLLRTLDGLLSGSVQPVPQEDSQASLAPRINKEMARVDWRRSAREIHNMVRAFNPWPLAFSEFRNERVQILRSAAAGGMGNADPGVFLGFSRDGMMILCGSATVLEVLQVKPASRQAVSGREFGVGARLKPNEPVFR